MPHHHHPHGRRSRHVRRSAQVRGRSPFDHDDIFSRDGSQIHPMSLLETYNNEGPGILPPGLEQVLIRSLQFATDFHRRDITTKDFEAMLEIVRDNADSGEIQELDRRVCHHPNNRDQVVDAVGRIFDRSWQSLFMGREGQTFLHGEDRDINRINRRLRQLWDDYQDAPKPPRDLHQSIASCARSHNVHAMYEGSTHDPQYSQRELTHYPGFSRRRHRRSRSRSGTRGSYDLPTYDAAEMLLRLISDQFSPR